MEKQTFSQRMSSFGRFIYNSEEGKVLGRGGRSWAEIGLFYLIYYTCLAGFFSATLAVFYETVDSNRPKLQGKDSLLKGNPGMGYQPMPDIETTLVRTSRDASLKDHTDSLIKSYKSVLDDYNLPADSKTIDCGGLAETRPGADSACKVDVPSLTTGCNEGSRFGMDEDKPCILLKLNKIFGWTPEVWETADEAKEAGVPQEIVDQYSNDRIWIYCHGENPGDEDNIGLGQIKYYPQQGFPLRYYPYLMQTDYRAPLVFVQFQNLTKHVALMVECKALAKNIKVDAMDKEGSVHFELLSDPIVPQ